jgi:magnesium-transporting ATPase (P-type)
LQSDFPSTAVAIARQCGIIRNQKVDDFRDLTSGLNAPIKEYNGDDPMRIVKSIVLSGKDMLEMKDEQWEQVNDCFIRSLIEVMPIRGNRVR